MLKKIINSFALIFETAKKEKELIQKDSAVIEIYILFVALVYFFYTFVYSPEIFTNLPVAYVDNDQTTISHQIKRMLNETESLEITAEPTSLDEGRKLFEEGKVNGIILIPKNFSKELQKNGGNASIAIYSDASYMLYYDKTLQAVTNSLGAFTGALQLKQTMMSGVPMKQAEASSKPFNIIANPLYNLEEGYAIFLIPVVLIIALQTLQLTGMGVLYGTMRENDTFTTHFAMAKQRFGYFFMTIGRAIPYLVISMLLLLLGILVVFHIFTIPQRGNLFEVIVFLIPVVLAITFLGQSLMNIFRNREDTIMLLTVFSIPALMMGGVSYPIVAFPLWIKIMAFFFPSTIGVKGFISLSQAGATLVEIKETYIQMWIICLFYFVIAVWTNRRFIYQVIPSKIPAKSEEFEAELDQKLSANDTNSLREISTNNSFQEKENSFEEIKPVHAQIITETSENEKNELIEKAESLEPNVVKNNIHLLYPFREMVANFDETISKISNSLNNKLSHVTSENLQSPVAYIAVPTLKTLRYVSDSKELTNLYLNLLANAMDKSAIKNVHPSYIELIKHLTPDEANLLNVFVENSRIPFINIVQLTDKNSENYELILEKHNHIIEDYRIMISHPDNLELYLENLIRIGLLRLENSSLENTNYEHLENCEITQHIRKNIENKGYQFKTQRGYFKTTAFGNGFLNAVIKNK